MRLGGYSTGGNPPEEYVEGRRQLQRKLAAHLRAAMASLVGNMENADLMLVSADGKRIPAHECILRARAPGFYQRHVEATITAMGRHRSESGQLREVAIGDIDSAGLEFFIHSVYTEDEIAAFPSAQEGAEDRRDSGSRQSRHSFQMDDSTTDLEDFRSDMEDSNHKENDPAPRGDGPPPGNNQRYAPPGYAAGTFQPQPQVYQGGEVGGLRETLLRQTSNSIYASPQMTSFRDLATGSPMNSSLYSLGGRSEVGPDIPEEEEEGLGSGRQSSARTEVSMSKFIRLDSLNEPSRSSPAASPTKRQKAIFPMFIGLGDEDERGGVPEGIRGRAMMAKRLSVASLTSLTSIDVMTSSEVHLDPPEKHPSCRLASDLLKMYLDNIDTDVVIRTENGDLFAHKCLLSAFSPFFRQQLKKSPRIEMKGYTKNTVHFLLSFLYGGVTCIPDEVDVWEVVSLATHLNLKHLVEVVILHLKMTKCHFFHRPCSGCVSATFDALPQFHSIRCLRPLYDEVMAWQARHFSRIWKGRVFLHLNEKWHKECFEAVIGNMDDESIIDIILGCERLQTCLPRVRSEGSSIVAGYVNDILEMALQYLTLSFHLVVTSKSFSQQGKGLALNVGLLEDLLPPLVHSLSADVAIKSFMGLAELRDALKEPRQDERGLPDECSPRFAALVCRLYDLVDKHLLHFAASVVKSECFGMLKEEEQRRIEETGLFVEMRQPRATPPRLSSFYRTYKRSASAGVHPMAGAVMDNRKRTQSIERTNSPLLQVEAVKGSTGQAREQDVPMEETPRVEEKVVTKEEEKKREVKEKEKKTVEKKVEEPPVRSEPSTSSSTPPTKPKEPRPTPATTSRDTVAAKEVKDTVPPKETTVTTRRSSEGRRSPTKTTTTSRPRAIETEEGGRFERQQTHTIIPPTEAARAAAAQLPGPSPKKLPEKPKSVVKPMPQESLAKEKSLPRVGGVGGGGTIPGQVPRSTQGKEAKPPVRSSIPRKAATPTVKSLAEPARRRGDAIVPSKAPRSPKTARKTMPN